MTNLRQNRAKKNLSDGKIVSVPMGPMNGDLIEHFGPLGFDAMWLEGEHGPVDFNNIPDLTRACDLWDMTPSCEFTKMNRPPSTELSILAPKQSQSPT